MRRFCDRVLIMYAGRIVEALPAARLDQAQHPYTRGLLAALPRVHDRRARLAVLTPRSALERCTEHRSTMIAAR